MEQRIFQIALSLLSGIGPVKAKALVAHVGSVEGIFKENEKSLGLIPGIGAGVVKSLNRSACLERAEQELVFIEKSGIDLYYYQDERYPASLKFCDDGPIVLFTRGNVNFNKKNVAVVGTRKATTYGKSITRELIAQLADQDVQIVSGLAYGIDIEAHKAALANGLSTLAVLGHGLDLIYPAAHKSTAHLMLENGGLVTEFLSNSAGDTSNFPKRNRIVAGLCNATVVVESAFSGGSLITANLANDYSRDVFAFPGNVTQEYSKGCNSLIQQNKAHLITCAADLVRIMGWKQREISNFSTIDNTQGSPVMKQTPVIQTQLFAELTDEEDKLVRVLREKGEVDIDNLGYAAQMTSGMLSVHLFNLELKGLVKAAPGKRYSLL
ncbi:MAG: DNA-protecting protein DprA [Bacteroidetes bacterium]|nr:DNA-protecting protein DprA [Bacteroidota bacterium]